MYKLEFIHEIIPHNMYRILNFKQINIQNDYIK